MSEISQRVIKGMINSTTSEKLGWKKLSRLVALRYVIGFLLFEDKIRQNTSQHCKHEISLTGVQPVHNCLAKALDAFGLHEKSRILLIPLFLQWLRILINGSVYSDFLLWIPPACVCAALHDILNTCLSVCLDSLSLNHLCISWKGTQRLHRWKSLYLCVHLLPALLLVHQHRPQSL